MILSWGSKATWLGPKWAMVAALAFPVGYTVYDFSQRRKFSFVSAIGFLSILITGSFALMQLDVFWFAVKEAAVPGVIGLVVLASTGTRWPLVNEMLYNPQVIDVPRVDAALAERNTRPEFEAAVALVELLADVVLSGQLGAELRTGALPIEEPRRHRGLQRGTRPHESARVGP